MYDNFRISVVYLADIFADSFKKADLPVAERVWIANHFFDSLFSAFL